MRRRIASALGLVALLCALAVVAAAAGEVVSGGNVRVAFRGWISPQSLPRTARAPVTLHVGGTVQPIGGRHPASLKRVRVEFNRHGRLLTSGLPVCPMRRVAGASSEEALQRCRSALVGSGRFRAHIEIPEGAPFPAVGRMLAFNSRVHGRPALIAHVYGIDPVPTSQVLPISLRRHGEDGFGPTLTVRMPQVGEDWGYVTGFEMTFHRLYRTGGRTRSFLSASCPAPTGISEAPFRAARGTYFLAGGHVLTKVIQGSCRVRSAR
jgi:hypothetical protein